MKREISNAQTYQLLDLLVEAASEHAELRANLGNPEYAPAETERRELQARARLEGVRKAVHIVLGVEPTDPPF